MLRTVRTTNKISEVYPAINSESRVFWVGNSYYKIVRIRIWEETVNYFDCFNSYVLAETFADESIERIEKEVDRILESGTRIEVVELMVLRILHFRPNIFGPEFVSWVYDAYATLDTEERRKGIINKFQKIIKDQP